MNKKQYAEYEKKVSKATEGLDFLSTGAREGCADCDGFGAFEEFSWRSCEICDSKLGGARHAAHAVVKFKDDGEEMAHFMVCSDCVYYLEYGQLDDMSMLDMEEES